ncbi:transmembrane 4 L6 family member 4-like [Scomber scombrus]|uniref:Transmembrane 4 L6 family member 4-like n=2 Tax=Scomber scombrus TaxID=13677 RepID=A0AAV1N2P6_SCOSC|nr:transmembrane 4 L6 family member 4-like [Scomber scombrus]
MCTGKCTGCIGVILYPLVVISIICNIMLFFPGWDIKYVKDGHITVEVKYLGGLLGGGLMVLIPAIYIHMTEVNRCCGNRCGMFLSIPFAAVALLGALYSFAVATLALHNGPLCKNETWTTPFNDKNFKYLTNYKSWGDCTEPKNIVQFNTVLFVILLVTSCLQGLLCAIQMIIGLIGCVCGVFFNKEEP